MTAFIVPYESGPIRIPLEYRTVENGYGMREPGWWFRVQNGFASAVATHKSQCCYNM